MTWKPGDPITCRSCGVAYRRNAAGLLAHPASKCSSTDGVAGQPREAPKTPVPPAPARPRKPRPVRQQQRQAPVARNFRGAVNGPRTLPMLQALSEAPAGLTTPQLAELAGGASSWVNALGATRVLMLKQQARGRVEQAGTAAGNRTRESALWRITDEGRRYVQAAAEESGSVVTWKPGDRVWVNPTMDRGDLVQGTVREVDPGGRRGVLVDLDRPVRGLSTCTATHAELRPVAESGQPAGGGGR